MSDQAQPRDTNRYPGDRIFGWTNHPRAGLYCLIAAAAFAGIVLLASIALGMGRTVYPIASTPGFFALLGFLTVGGLAVLAIPLTRLLGRSEDFYDGKDASDG